MKFLVDVKLNDGKSEMPPIEISGENFFDCMDSIAAEMQNDYGTPFGVGMTVFIERME